MTVLLTKASMMNYPGGEALAFFNARYADQDYGNVHRPPDLRTFFFSLLHTQVHVHISNRAAQSGASLFLHTHAPPYIGPNHSPTKSSPVNWVYNKTESVSPQALMRNHNITHLIAEEPCPKPLGGWRKGQSIPAFRGWKVDMDVIRARSWGQMEKALKMTTGDELCILEREWTF
jgi:alpha-1,6-mannosyltransferase